MSTPVEFRSYRKEDMASCLQLFDLNCPAFFAENEREDYIRFLDAVPPGYDVCLVDGEIEGAFGLLGEGRERRRLNWILLNPRAQGRGLGSAVMRRIMASARASRVDVVDIAASHKSAPFFARFGAVTVAEMENGWGLGMHRVDMELRP